VVLRAGFGGGQQGGFGGGQQGGFGGGQGGFDAKGNFGGQGAEFGGVTYQGPVSRLGNSFCNLCVGVVLVFVTCYAEYANEQTFVLAEATADLVGTALPLGCSQSADVAHYTNELVLVSCPVVQPDLAHQLPSELRSFVSSFHGTSLRYDTEIYQWRETSEQQCHKTNSGGQVCTTIYHYNSHWSSSPINSANFHSYNSAYHNSGSFPTNLQGHGQLSAQAEDVVMSIGGGPSDNSWLLTQALVDQFPSKAVNVVGPPQPQNSQYPGYGTLTSDMLYDAGHGHLETGYPGAPRIGDLRIRFSGYGVPQGGYGTVCAQQTSYGRNFSFQPYPGQPFDMWGRVTNPLSHFEAGQQNPEEFQQIWHSANDASVMVVRLFLWFLMVCSIIMVFSPLSVMADALLMFNFCTCGLGSLLDSAAQGLINCAAFLVGTVLFLIVFAVAWAVSNPTFGVSLLAGALVAYIVGLKFMHKSAKAAKGRELSYVKIEDMS